jgi:hypothetical protein
MVFGRCQLGLHPLGHSRRPKCIWNDAIWNVIWTRCFSGATCALKGAGARGEERQQADIGRNPRVSFSMPALYRGVNLGCFLW